MMKIPSPRVKVREISVSELAFESFDKHANQIALVDGTNGQSYTFAQLHRAIRQVASGLARMGVKKGDIVVMFSPNSPEYVFMFYALLANGAIVTTINPAYTVYEVTRHLKEFHVSWMYTVKELTESLLKDVKQVTGMKGVVCHGEAPGTIPLTQLLSDNAGAYPNDVTVNVREDIATLPSSSGTTGLPKGVMITNYNIVAMITAYDHADFRPRLPPGGSQNHVLAMSPFYHAFGMVRVLIFSLLRGDRLIILPRFKPEQFLDTIHRYKITELPSSPPLIVFLAKSPLVPKYDLSSILQVHSGSAPLSRETEREFRKRLKDVRYMTQGYGMTETTTTLTRTNLSRSRKPGSSGLPLPNTEIQVVDIDSQRVLGPNQRGEVWGRGPQVTKGYWNNPQATRTTVDSDGWIHTGDIGYYDDEGDVFIVDRLKELIKTKGFQVAPAELEALILNHPSVADVAVIGVPDERAGELPKAFVVKKDDVILSAQDLMQYVDERVANYKQLKGGIDFVTSIPKSASGKILRRELRSRQQTTSKI